MKGRTVRIYLVDGTPNGVLNAEIINWTGMITVVPRTRLADLAALNEVQRTGLYVLTGEDVENQNRELIYIGESDNVWKRLTEHNADSSKDFWRRTAIITSKDPNLTKAHCRYLESRLIQLACQAQRSKLQNGTNPELPSLPRSDVADMETFLDDVQLLLPVLGFSFAVQLPTTRMTQVVDASQRAAPTFELTEVGVNALAQEIGDEFIVLKGSTARKKHIQSAVPGILDVRDQLVADAKLIDHDHDFWTFATDVPFPSPSTAADVVTGGKYNGRIKWKVQNTSKTYAEWQQEQIRAAEATIQS